ncbi:hypothetical protein JZ751_008660 [Albula glossodonta]|uniref:Chemokine interleukin-8-like domain-containing protein n=1 Tax=Albula glossodonta TaxID=121402 RepID=A0A8T2P194_9TELE|nr:hypothetical protein JZ751_008660 [Albula glossodonta]
MNCRVTVAVAIICLASLSFITEGIELRCTCISTHGKFIPLRHIHNLELIPAGAHCGKPEVIFTVKGGKTTKKVCVNPEAKWVKNMINLMAKKLKNKLTERPIESGPFRKLSVSP